MKYLWVNLILFCLDGDVDGPVLINRIPKGLSPIIFLNHKVIRVINIIDLFKFARILPRLQNIPHRFPLFTLCVKRCLWLMVQIFGIFSIEVDNFMVNRCLLALAIKHYHHLLVCIFALVNGWWWYSHRLHPRGPKFVHIRSISRIGGFLFGLDLKLFGIVFKIYRLPKNDALRIRRLENYFLLLL